MIGHEKCVRKAMDIENIKSPSHTRRVKITRTETSLKMSSLYFMLDDVQESNVDHGRTGKPEAKKSFDLDSLHLHYIFH